MFEYLSFFFELLRLILKSDHSSVYRALGPEGYIYDDDVDDGGAVFCIGFGMSKISGQYKVVCINVDVGSDSCRHVYTLGTGAWRLVEAGAASDLTFPTSRNIVCNGILHCIFSAPPPPPPPPVDRRSRLIGELSALRDCLCNSYTWEGEIFIWMMKEYHVEESWTTLHKISSNVSNLSWASSFHWNYKCVEPIRLFKDGDILMLLVVNQFSYYSNKTKTVQQVAMFKDAVGKDYVSALIFTPSLFSLKNFGFENVISF
ncbi:uncharacterized protein LOC121781371 [Salvia splendens]|uniref:uncharacterized protein LOC121781371 n=1 Tax=Salvia splendens TaxID=180675 RepID=UPI001C255DEF|nr:uncharacterized protein LOC121781371 [Salvia splendens]